MLLRFGLSASPSGQLLYLIHRDPLVKSALFDSKSMPARRLTKRDPVSCNQLVTDAGQLLYLISLRLLVKLAAGDVWASPTALFDSFKEWEPPS